MADMPTTYSGDVRIGVIGGTGLTAIKGFVQVASIPITTPWGVPSSPVTILEHISTSDSSTSTGQRGSIAIAFLNRHGLHHEFGPHETNSRANIGALRKIGVRTIIAFSAVGSLKEEIRPRDFLVPDQIIDCTRAIRPSTFFEDGVVGHVPFADPFDAALARVVMKSGANSLQAETSTSSSTPAETSPPALHEHGTLVCMEGPQFSTRAESNLYRAWGGSVINMSCLPEAKLAREAELAYQMICMATDYDCWRTDDDAGATVSVNMVMEHMKANASNATRLLATIVDELATNPEHAALLDAKHLQGQSRSSISTAPAAVGSQPRQRINWLFPGTY